MVSVEDILQTALELERKGRTFYVEASQRVKDPVAVAVLVSLGDDEEAHERLIERYFAAVQHRSGLPEDGPAAPRSARERIDDILASTVGRIPQDAVYRQVYETAAQMERKTYEFYSAQIGQHPYPLTKFFEFLTDMERIHTQMIDMLLAG
jgi:rubrerythrin